MVITTDRSELEAALNGNFSICVLLGTSNSATVTVHTCLEGDWGPQPWYRWFLITDPSILTVGEMSNWFGSSSDTDYAFLGRTTNAITSNGSAEEDLLDAGECDYLSYFDKFAEADLQ